MSDIAVKVENLGKMYHIGARQEQYPTLRSALVSGVKRLITKRSAEEIGENTLWALKDVSFEVKQGEVVGIIGRNGAGKSTLLKVLSHITEPTKGRVSLYGRVGSLLEVGTGFHPELTGRDNIYLNGAILGMKRAEIERKFDEIVAFAEIERFLDTPVKRYSSGMYVRLAFAVAAHLEPEILLVDEVLSVGDAAFQKKCLGKMSEVANEGRTVLFVSHQLDMIRSLCTRGILLYQGKILMDSTAWDTTDKYLESGRSDSQNTHFDAIERSDFSFYVMRARVIGEDGQEKNQFDVFSKIILEFEYVVRKPLRGSVINFELKRNGLTLFLSFDTDENPERLLERKPGTYISRVEIPNPLLKSGTYSISTNTGIANLSVFQHLDDMLVFDVVLISKPSAFLSYADNRPGVLTIPLNWQTEIKNTRR